MANLLLNVRDIKRSYCFEVVGGGWTPSADAQCPVLCHGRSPVLLQLSSHQPQGDTEDADQHRDPRVPPHNTWAEAALGLAPSSDLRNWGGGISVPGRRLILGTWRPRAGWEVTPRGCARPLTRGSGPGVQGAQTGLVTTNDKSNCPSTGPGCPEQVGPQALPCSLGRVTAAP